LNAHDTPSVSQDAIDRAWGLTQQISPRARVRVAAEDAYGQILNAYPGDGIRTAGPAPERPWAMYLADSNHLYRFVCFDLDVKAHGIEAVDADTRLICRLLEDASIPYLVCQSGPAGGRHVWIALSRGVPAHIVKALALGFGSLCPTLDKAPLSNPVTGCVRPPYSPHRDGGVSLPILGALDAITTAAVTPAHIDQLLVAVDELVAERTPEPLPDPHRPLPIDKHGRIYLPGSRRALPQTSALALREDAACGDASSVLWRILLGAATARWRYSDVLELWNEPGLEHVRSVRQGSQRVPRPTSGDQAPARVLARQWDKAVRLVATSTRAGGADPTFEPRAREITDLVERIQERATATPGRWTTGAGPSDRRVLDVLCLLALQAVSTSVEADIRRLALQSGIGRETVRTALIRLGEDGWIVRSRESEGQRAAHWSIDPRSALHRDPVDTRSQADPRPGGAGAARRSQLMNHLSGIITFRTHDAFTNGPGLGTLAGNAYGEISAAPTTEESPGLRRLHAHGLTRWTPAGWVAAPLAALDAVALHLGVHGRLEARRRTYWVEREAWSAWRDELEWMHLPTAQKRKRRPPGSQQHIYKDGTTRHGAHPRTADGRADFREARRLAEAAWGGAPAPRKSATVTFVDDAAA
jgi:hypothetical protein